MLSRQMELFVKAAEMGSFSKAARALYIAPASLIQQVNSLEARLGIKLFDRGPQGVELTEAGAFLYREASAAMKSSKSAIARARAIQNGEPCIRIGASLLFKCRELNECCSRMFEEHPDTRVEFVSVASPGEASWKPLAGIGVDYDLLEGLYLSEVHEGRCDFLKLKDVPILPAVAPSHPLARKERICMEDLAGETVVLLREGLSRSYDELRAALAAIPGVTIVDSKFYSVETFADCEINGRVLMTPENWQDVHPGLQLRGFDHVVYAPYGIMSASDLGKRAALLLEYAKEAASRRA